jgi:hypothetical protein
MEECAYYESQNGHPGGEINHVMDGGDHDRYFLYFWRWRNVLEAMQ